MRIAICIGTFRRPELLRQLLEGLSRLTFLRMPLPALELIVVDNDPLCSGYETLRCAVLPHPFRYLVEPRPGIAHVRNRAVAEARDADFVAFLDDDEVPCETWLDELLYAQARFRADVVAGPTRPVYERCVPSWVRCGGFFERPEFQTGKSLEFCAAGNVLVRRAVFDQVSQFDERFQLTGGEDTQFFLRVQRAGFKIIWSNEAVVREIVPKERATLGWILRRGYQSGNSWSLSELSIETGPRVRLARVIKGSAHVIIGLAGTFIGAFLGKAALAKALRRAFLGAGMIAGLAGIKYLAYESPTHS